MVHGAYAVFGVLAVRSRGAPYRGVLWWGTRTRNRTRPGGQMGA